MNSDQSHRPMRFADVDPEKFEAFRRFNLKMSNLNAEKRFLDAAPGVIADYKRSDLSVPNETVRLLLSAARARGMTQIKFESTAGKLRPNVATRKLKKNGERDGLGGRLWHFYMNPKSDKRMTCHTFLQYLVEFVNQGWIQQDEARQHWLTCTSIATAAATAQTARGNASLYVDLQNAIWGDLLHDLNPAWSDDLQKIKRFFDKRQGVDSEGWREKIALEKILEFQAKAGVELSQVWQRPPIDKVVVENFFRELEKGLASGEDVVQASSI